MTVLIGKFIKQQGMLWLLLALFIAFSSSLTLNEVGIRVVEFQKPHPTVASFIFFTVFLSTLFIKDSKIPKRLILAILTIIIFSTIIMSPVSTAFLLTFFVLMLVLSYLLDNSYDKFALKVGLVTIVVAFIGILSFNLFTFGVAEMTPMSFFLKYKINSIFEQSVSPNLVELSINRDLYSGEAPPHAFTLPNFDHLIKMLTFVFYDNTMVPIILYIILILMVLMLSTSREFTILILSVVLMAIIAFTLLSLSTQHSIYRYVNFIVFLKTIIYIGVLHLTCKFISREGGGKTVVVVIITICTVFAMGYNPIFEKNKILNSDDKIKFLSGEYAFADLYEKKWGAARLGKSIIDLIGNKNKVMTLSPMYGIYGVPGWQFQYQIFTDIYKKGDFEAFIFGKPEVAKEVLLRHNFAYVLIDYKLPMLSPAYAPIFEPDSLKKHFKIARMGEGLLLLTLLDIGDPIDGKTLESYIALREESRKFHYAKAYYALFEKVKKEEALKSP